MVWATVLPFPEGMFRYLGKCKTTRSIAGLGEILIWEDSGLVYGSFMSTIKPQSGLIVSDTIGYGHRLS